MEANVNLTAAELNVLCSVLGDLIIAEHGEAEALKAMWKKFHGAWGQQILAPGLSAAIEKN